MEHYTSNFTDEHRAAFDWLNEITEEDYGFFALEIELWKIGSSVPAPKFNVVSRPNDWRKQIADTPSQQGKLSDTKQLYLRYWSKFNSFLADRQGTVFRSQKPQPQHWTCFAIGRGGFTMTATASIEKQRIGAEIYIQPNDIDPKGAFISLGALKFQVQHFLGENVAWEKYTVI